MSDIARDLQRKKCVPCEGGVSPMTEKQIATMLMGLTGWEHRDGLVRKTFSFKDYYQTIAFVNATAWISNREDHHPDISVGYNKCEVAYMTHAIKGISENDFICAAKIDALFGL